MLNTRPRNTVHASSSVSCMATLRTSDRRRGGGTGGRGGGEGRRERRDALAAFAPLPLECPAEGDPCARQGPQAVRASSSSASARSPGDRPPPASRRVRQASQGARERGSSGRRTGLSATLFLPFPVAMLSSCAPWRDEGPPPMVARGGQRRAEEEGAGGGTSPGVVGLRRCEGCCSQATHAGRRVGAVAGGAVPPAAAGGSFRRAVSWTPQHGEHGAHVAPHGWLRPAGCPVGPMPGPGRRRWCSTTRHGGRRG